MTMIEPEFSDRDEEIVAERSQRAMDAAEGGYDNSAPYGYLKDGVTPRKKPGPAKGTAKPASGSPAPTAPRPTRKKGPNPRARVSATPDYRDGIAGLLQIPAFILASAGRLNPVLEYDGLAIAIATPNIAEAVNSLAQEEPRVAAVLDKILQVGPYGAILGALVPLAAQIAVNHKKMPAGTLGTQEPEAMKAALVAAQEG